MPHETVHPADARPEPPDGASVDGASVEPPGRGQHPGRRTVVAFGAAAALGATGVAAVAGCSSASSGGSTGGSVGPAVGDSSTGAAAGAGAGSALAKLADVPVGGATAAAGPDGAPIIVAQPATGKVVAFSARCTHQGCTVIVNGAQLDCPCHGSVFDALSGKVINGPAASPLPSVSVKISGGNVVST